MTPERWRQIERTFHRALSLPPDQRPSFLDRACGRDAELRRDVERMLESEQDSKFLNTPIAARADAMLAEDDEELPAGKQLSHYQIVKRIGVGGMGEVYQAKDTKLFRTVALKILPEQYTQDEDRLRRFKIEAMAAARLNHQNIITIYEVEEAEGLHFIATEFIEGRTLRERLTQGRLELAEALGVAIQVAGAVEAAHAAGIVHRDIKPENIMLRPDGVVKTLDFGLAKLAEWQSPAAAMADAEGGEGRPANVTQDSTLMGTPRYMAPEQVRKQNVDGRADLFSLGGVLYEMIAGRPPFDGESPDDLFAAILHQEPKPLSQLAPKTPAAVEKIVRTALAKDAKDRYQKVGAMRADLEAVRRWLDDKQRRASNLVWWGAAAAVCVLGIFFLVKGWLTSTSEWPVNPDQASTMLVEKSIQSGAGISRASFSPDGNWVAYGLSNEGKTILFVRQMNGPADWAVTDGKWRDRDPIWSTDGRKLLFISNREGKHGIWALPFASQAPLSSRLPQPVLLREFATQDEAAIADEGILIASDDDERLLYIELKLNLYTLVPTSGQFTRLTSFDPAKSQASGFALSPRRDQIAYSSLDTQDGARQIFVRPLQGGTPKQITFGEGTSRYPSWFPDGKTIAYSSNRPGRYQIYLADVRGRPPLHITTGESHHLFIAVSPDGKKMIYLSQKETGRIFSCDVQTGAEEELTSDSRLNRWPDESPDGRWFSFQSLDANDSSMNESVIIQPPGISPVRGDGPPKRFETTGFDTKWAPDGKLLALFRASLTGNRWDLRVFDTHDGSERLLTTNAAWGGITRLPDNRRVTSYNWSPDGTEIAYCSSSSGVSNIVKISVGPNAAGEELVSHNMDRSLRASDPCWAPRGGRIAYVLGGGSSASGLVRFVWVTGKTAPVFEHGGWLRLLGWSASGKDIYIALGSREPSMPITDSVTFLKIDVDSGSRTPLLTFPSVYLHSAKLASDGKRIAFVSRKTGQDNAYILSLADGKARKITNNGDTKVYLSGLNWSPGGKQLYYSKQTGRSEIWAFRNLP